MNILLNSSLMSDGEIDNHIEEYYTLYDELDNMLQSEVLREEDYVYYDEHEAYVNRYDLAAAKTTIDWIDLVFYYPEEFDERREIFIGKYHELIAYLKEKITTEPYFTLWERELAALIRNFGGLSWLK